MVPSGRRATTLVRTPPGTPVVVTEGCSARCRSGRDDTIPPRVGDDDGSAAGESALPPRVTTSSRSRSVGRGRLVGKDLGGSTGSGQTRSVVLRLWASPGTRLTQPQMPGAGSAAHEDDSGGERGKSSGIRRIAAIARLTWAMASESTVGEGRNAGHGRVQRYCAGKTSKRVKTLRAPVARPMR